MNLFQNLYIVLKGPIYSHKTEHCIVHGELFLMEHYKR
jgi:hypothetical protein